MGRVSSSSVTKIRMPSKLDKKGKEFYEDVISDSVRGLMSHVEGGAAQQLPRQQPLLILSAPEL